MTRIALALGALLLAGCGEADKAGGGEAGGGTSVEGAAALAATVFEPGQWEMKTRVTAVDMPGAPPEATAAMTGKETVVKHCMTQAEAERSPGDMFRKAAEGKCTYDNFDMEGGKISAKMQCAGQRPGETMQTVMSGAYDRKTYRTDMKMTVKLPGQPSPMSMSATTEGRRIGACA